MTPHNPKNAQSQILPLTSVRGVAAFWVYLNHMQFLTSSNRLVNGIAAHGHFGVDIFFILSGFIISYVHFEEFGTFEGCRKNTGRFLLLRLARIYPLHLITLLLVFALDWTRVLVNSVDTPTHFVLNLFLLQKSFFGDAVSYNMVSWSIGVEWMLYLAFPLFVWAVMARLTSVWSNLLLVVAALGLWAYYLCPTCTRSFMEHYLNEPTWSLVRGALGFAIGAGLWRLFTFGFLKRLPWDFIVLLDIAVFLGFIELKSYNVALPDFGLIAIFTVLIYGLAQARGFMCRLFSSKLAFFLGTISYSFYMWHWLYVVIYIVCFKERFPMTYYFSFGFAALTLGLIALSAASYYAIERPVRKWLRRKIS